jgi:hypothetical protein
MDNNMVKVVCKRDFGLGEVLFLKRVIFIMVELMKHIIIFIYFMILGTECGLVMLLGVLIRVLGNFQKVDF